MLDRYILLSGAVLALALSAACVARGPAATTERSGPDATPTAAAASAAAADGDNPELLMEGEPAPPLRSWVAPDQGLAIARSARPLSAGLAVPEGAPADPGTMAARLQARAARSDLFRLHVLNIGAGTCSLLECPGSDDVILYDCGQKAPTENDLSADEVRVYVETVLGGDRPVVVLSHADSDHVNLVADALGNRVPEAIWFGGDRRDYRGDIARWLTRHNRADVPTFFGWKAGYSARGEKLEGLQCGDASAYLLTVNTRPGTNPSSLMLLYEYGAFSVVLAGDAEGPGEARAIDNHGQRLDGVTVVMASHHGANSHKSNHEAWVTTLEPSVVIYSSGVRYGHPKGDVVERYSTHVIDSESHSMWEDPPSADGDTYSTRQSEYVTELVGTVVIETDGTEFSIECSRDSFC